jgi:hypothetical protein
MVNTNVDVKTLINLLGGPLAAPAAAFGATLCGHRRPAMG